MIQALGSFQRLLRCKNRFIRRIEIPVRILDLNDCVGNLRTRISLPIALSQNFDSLVSDGVDNILVAITGQTGSGIAVIDLTSISEPPPQSYFETSSIVDSGPLQISRPVLPVRRSSLEVGPDVPITVTQHRDGPAVLGKR